MKITTPVAIERWTQALRVLRELTPHERREHFDMKYWGKKTECGTAACLGGWCALDPWFRRRGLIGKWVGDEEKAVLDFPKKTPTEFFNDCLEGPYIFGECAVSYAGIVKMVKAHIAKLKKHPRE